MADRRERVLIDLIVSGQGDVARSSAEVALLEARLKSLDGTTVKTGDSSRRMAANADRMGSSLKGASADMDSVGTSTRRTGAEIDALSGRVRIFADLAAILGPALVPIGAVAVPAVATLAAGLGAAGLAAGSALIAFQGVGDATKAIDAYDLAPTAANLEKVNEAMAQLAPSAAAFTLAFQDFQPVLGDIQKAAANGIFPGLTESLDNFEKVGPKVAAIFREVGKATGDGVRDFSEELAGPRYEEFLRFLRTAAPDAISSLGSSLSDITHGVTELMMNLNPGIQGGFGWIEDIASGFDSWASSAKGAEDIEDILAYVRETGPQVADLVGSLGSAFAALARAAAPLGGPVLSALTGIVDAFAGLANSSIGTPLVALAAGMATLSRAAKIGSSTMGLFTRQSGVVGKTMSAQAGSLKAAGAAMLTVTSAQDRARMSASDLAAAEMKKGAALRSGAVTAAKAGAAVAGLAVLSTGAADKIGVTNTASLALMGTMAGPWGAALGGAAGAVLDLRAANENLTASVDAANAAVDAGDFDKYREQASAARGELNKGLGETWLSTSQNVARGWARDLGSGLGIVKQSTGEIRNELRGLDAEVVALDWGDKLFAWGTESEGGRIKEVGAAIGSIGSEADSAAAGAERLQDALDGLLSPTLDAEAATDQWRASLQALRTELDAGAGFTDMTEAGRANKALTRQVVEDTQTRLTAMAADGAGQGKLAASLKETRSAFIANGVAAGFDVGAMRRRANAIGLTPKLVKTVFESLGAEGVQKQAANLRRIYNQLPKSVQTDIKANGVPKSRADVNSLVKQYNLTPKQKTTLMRLVTAAAMGNGKAVQALLRQIGGLKPTPRAGLDIGGLMKGAGTARNTLNQVGGLRPKPRIDGDASGAISAANAARGAIAGVQGKTVYITTVHRDVRQGVSAAKSAQDIGGANGGIFGEGRGYGRLGLKPLAFADGGGFDQDGRYFDRVPQIVTGGRNIMWAEPETGREAYISDKPGMEARNLEILTQAADWFGATVETYAKGGTRNGKGGGGGSGNKQRQRGGMSPEAREAMREVREILEPINKAFRKDLKKADNREERMDAFRDRLKKSTDALKKETDQRKKITEDMRSFASEVTGAYRHDIFGNGLAGLQLQLDADANDARTAMADLGRARGNGLNGALLEALQRSGDTNTISQVSALDRAGIARLEAQYASSMAATGALGNQAAQIKFGDQLADVSRVVARLDRTVDTYSREVRNMGKNIKDGARQGSHEGSRSGTAKGNRDNDKATTRGTRSTGRGGGRRNR